MEITVKTKEDFERAKKELPEIIVFEGEMAKKIQKAIKTKKIGKAVGIGGGILTTAGAISAIIVGVVAAPATGGILPGRYCFWFGKSCSDDRGHYNYFDNSRSSNCCGGNC
jgi:hypothetical protein